MRAPRPRRAVVERATVDFDDIDFGFYDSGGPVAEVGVNGPGSITFNSDGTATDELTIYTSTSIGVSSKLNFMGRIVPGGDGSAWSFEMQ